MITDHLARGFGETAIRYLVLAIDAHLRPPEVSTPRAICRASCQSFAPSWKIPLRLYLTGRGRPSATAWLDENACPRQGPVAAGLPGAGARAVPGPDDEAGRRRVGRGAFRARGRRRCSGNREQGAAAISEVGLDARRSSRVSGRYQLACCEHVVMSRPHASRSTRRGPVRASRFRDAWGRERAHRSRTGCFCPASMGVGGSRRRLRIGAGARAVVSGVCRARETRSGRSRRNSRVRRWSWSRSARRVGSSSCRHSRRRQSRGGVAGICGVPCAPREELGVTPSPETEAIVKGTSPSRRRRCATLITRCIQFAALTAPRVAFTMDDVIAKVELPRRRFTWEEYHQMQNGDPRTRGPRGADRGRGSSQMTPIGRPHAPASAELNRRLVPAVGDRALLWPQNPVRLPRDTEAAARHRAPASRVEPIYAGFGARGGCPAARRVRTRRTATTGASTPACTRRRR